MTQEKTSRFRGLKAHPWRWFAVALLVVVGAIFVDVRGTVTPAQPLLSALGQSAPIAWAAPASDDATTATIQAVIQQANDAQQQAFAAQDPSVMKDTATSGYYNEMVQTNQDLVRGGVAAIKLLKLEWGPVTLTNATTATATTYETWQTTYADSTTDVSRDPNLYTLVLDQGAWKIQADDHPDLNGAGSSGQPAPGAGQAPTAPSGQVPPTSRVNPNSTDVSRNWSGYAATGGTYTSVSGTWTVPQSDGTVRFGSAATWIGIGGMSSRDLIQAGTQETSVGNGSVQYQAWIETLPQASHRVAFAVSPGDSVTVSITEATTNHWLISFTNNTTSATYQTTVTYSSSHSSAEWVQEAPSAGRGIVPLDNFGTVTFSAGSAVKDGQTESIAQVGGRPITMISSYGGALATPSALAADGGSFSVTYSAPATGTQPAAGQGTFPGQGRVRGQGGQPRTPFGGSRGNRLGGN